MNDPETWEVLERIHGIAEKYGLKLLPEIHASYGEGVYKAISEKGYTTYDFFLPGLIIDAMEHKTGEYLARWAKELIEKHISTVNMLGCHDGIPMLDLKGLLDDDRIQGLIDTLVARGGYVKNLHGAKNMYYQVNATYYSALGEDDRKLVLARAIQLFMPGKPQVWYLDLFAGKNDYAAMERAGKDGHKEINRSNLSAADIEEGLKRDVVRNQLELLRMRSTHRVFCPDASISASAEGSRLVLRWETAEEQAALTADLDDCSFTVSIRDNRTGEITYQYVQQP